MFFSDKGKYLYNRNEQIKTELTKRNFKLDKTRLFKITKFPKNYYNNWRPIWHLVNYKCCWYSFNVVIRDWFKLSIKHS